MDVENNKETDKSVNIGGLLVEARDNLGLTSKNIAEQMNLALEIIEKIENNDFEFDIPMAFVRGYIKSYATKVSLDTGPMLDEFDKLSGVPSPSLKRVQSISSFDKKRKEVNSSHYLFKSVSILILLAFLSFAGWELWNRFVINEQMFSESQELDISDISAQLAIDEDENNQTSPESEALPDSSVDDTGLGTQDSELDSEVGVLQDESNNGSDLGDEQEKPVEEKAQIESSLHQDVIDTANLKMTSLVLDFSADCWVKIVDARGEVIALGVKQSGKHMPVEGVAPINVILGDPSVVTMIYQGLDYDLSGYRVGRRAEIILE